MFFFSDLAKGTLAIFKNTMPSCNYIFKDGTSAVFVSGRYHTDDPKRIEELAAEVDAGHPHIYVDAAEATVQKEMLDPMNALRAKIIGEYLAAQAAATDPTNDMGKSTQGPVIPANTQDIQQAAAGGAGTPVTERLVMLAAGAAKVAQVVQTAEEVAAVGKTV